MGRLSRRAVFSPYRRYGVWAIVAALLLSAALWVASLVTVAHSQAPTPYATFLDAGGGVLGGEWLPGARGTLEIDPPLPIGTAAISVTQVTPRAYMVTYWSAYSWAWACCADIVHAETGEGAWVFPWWLSADDAVMLLIPVERPPPTPEPTSTPEE